MAGIDTDSTFHSYRAKYIPKAVRMILEKDAAMPKSRLLNGTSVCALLMRARACVSVCSVCVCVCVCVH